MKSNNISVAICIITFHRPLGLQRLLLSLCEQQFIHVNEPSWKIIVIDNDPEMPNQDLINSTKSLFDIPIYYDKEETRGFASARNRSIEIAGNVDFIAFVDDDEVVPRSWLDELLLAQISYNADVVLGPVIPKYLIPPPEWLEQGCFFERVKHYEGEELIVAKTNNVLVKYQWFHIMEGPFDIRFNLTGGEDSLFFSQLHKLGARIVWTNTAIVDEIIPLERMNIYYLVRRAIRMGNTRAIVELIIDPSIKTFLLRGLKGAYHITKGFVISIPKFVSNGYSGLLKSLFIICDAFGEILGLFGLEYKLYKQIEGD